MYATAPVPLFFKITSGSDSSEKISPGAIAKRFCRAKCVYFWKVQWVWWRKVLLHPWTNLTKIVFTVNFYAQCLEYLNLVWNYFLGSNRGDKTFWNIRTSLDSFSCSCPLLILFAYICLKCFCFIGVVCVKTYIIYYFK